MIRKKNEKRKESRRAAGVGEHGCEGSHTPEQMMNSAMHRVVTAMALLRKIYSLQHSLHLAVAHFPNGPLISIYFAEKATGTRSVLKYVVRLFLSHYGAV